MKINSTVYSAPDWLSPTAYHTPDLDKLKGPFRVASIVSPLFLRDNEREVVHSVWHKLYTTLIETLVHSMIGSKDYWVFNLYWEVATIPSQDMLYHDYRFVLGGDIFKAHTRTIMIPELTYSSVTHEVTEWRCAHCGVVNPYKDQKGLVVGYCGQTHRAGCGAPRAKLFWEK